ncbi:hypothetical protein PV327_003943, partial [Microctonus hyperodae]
MAARSYTAIIQPTGDSKSDYIAEAKVILRANGNLQSTTTTAQYTNLKLVTIDEIESDVVGKSIYELFEVYWLNNNDNDDDNVDDREVPERLKISEKCCAVTLDGQKPGSIKLKNALTRRQGANCNGGDEKPPLPDTDIYFGEDHDPANTDTVK